MRAHRILKNKGYDQGEETASRMRPAIVGRSSLQDADALEAEGQGYP